MIGQEKIFKMKKTESYNNAAVLNELVTRVLCDTAPRWGRADAAYLFAETRDNDGSVLAAGEFLWRLGRVRRVCIVNQKAWVAFPGFDSWKKKLLRTGVPRTRIAGIPLAQDFPPSTDAEATGLIRFAEARGWQTIYIVAQPLHQLRAFVSCVSAAKREKSNVFIFNFTGFPQRWEDRIVHSQGIQRGTRSNLIHKELKKISRYFKKGDLVSPGNVLKYMNKRDERIKSNKIL